MLDGEDKWGAGERGRPGEGAPESPFGLRNDGQPRKSKKPTLKRVRVKHDAIMDFMLANPVLRMREVAEHFGVSQSWLSTVVHSDAFQEQLRAKQEKLFGATVLPLREQVLGLAALAVDKLSEAVESADPEGDREYVADVTEMALKAAGMGPSKLPGTPVVQQNQQNNYYMVDAEALAEARERMRALQASAGEETPPALPGASADVGNGEAEPSQALVQERLGTLTAGEVAEPLELAQEIQDAKEPQEKELPRAPAAVTITLGRGD